MKFGVCLPNYRLSATPDGIRETAILAEELGFDSVWTTDHVMVAKGSPERYDLIFEALSVLAWVAGLTTRVRLGVSVLIITQRNAVLVAKEVATIDGLSNGRVILGLRAGWSEQVSSQRRTVGRVYPSA